MIRTCTLKNAAEHLAAKRPNKAPARALGEAVRREIGETGKITLHPCPCNPPCIIPNESLAFLLMEVPELVALLDAPVRNACR